MAGSFSTTEIAKKLTKVADEGENKHTWPKTKKTQDLAKSLEPSRLDSFCADVGKEDMELSSLRSISPCST